MYLYAYAKALFLNGHSSAHHPPASLSGAFRIDAALKRKLIMRISLTSIVIFLALLQVSASGYSQITLHAKNESIQQVFQSIEKQTKFNFTYDTKEIKEAGAITIDLNNVPINVAMDKCLQATTLSYKIIDQMVLVKKKQGTSEAPANQISPLTIKGTVTDSLGQPLSGATLTIKGQNKAYSTANDGSFNINAEIGDLVTVSYIGYVSYNFEVLRNNQIVNVSLTPTVAKLNEVIVSTGYQDLPKERATGAFEQVDNKLYNRITSQDIMSRLHDVVAGLYFSPPGSSIGNSVRGISSFEANAAPLLVVDDMPYDGDVNSINPNDVESVTVLKDAAASSIWGVAAGNGVIVITTKNGKYNEKLKLSFNSNITITNKPDLFYHKITSSTDDIGVEEFLFKKGYYASQLGNPIAEGAFVTPVVDLLNQQNLLPPGDATGRQALDQQINTYKNYDVRNDFMKYMYQNAIAQQYSLSLEGGSQQAKYMISGGFDKGIGSLVNTGTQRATLRSNIVFRPFKNLEISTNLNYANTISYSGGAIPYSNGEYYQYARLADSKGTALAPGTMTGQNANAFHYTNAVLDTLSKNPNLLNWMDKPIDDINTQHNKNSSQNITLDLGLKYTFNPVFSAHINYLYDYENNTGSSLFDADSYYVRNQINNFTDPTNGYNRAIPLGAIFNSGSGSFTNQDFRGEADANKNWNNKHELVAIAGVEAREDYQISNSFGTVYGYDPITKNFQYLNTQQGFNEFDGSGGELIDGRGISENYYRTTSIYANAAYTYLGRYTISASARKDASNVFGMDANKQNSPLWSGGIAWNVDKEPFYHNDILPTLKFRATYGYAGNVVLNVPAYATAQQQGNDYYTNLPYDIIQGFPNPNLRWEKDGMANIGLDFGFKNNIISGSIDYFDKRSTDLVVATPIDETIGGLTQTLNAGSLHGNGIELTFNSINVNSSMFRWSTNFIINYDVKKVTKYDGPQSSTFTYLTLNGNLDPVVGRDPYAIYAFKWAGLDPQTGVPRGYLGGQVSEDYGALTGVPLNQLQYFGSAVPVTFGSLKNYLNYKNLEVSINIKYEFGYYFLKNALNYNSYFSSGYASVDYEHRWQKPGDEKTTNVPAIIYPDSPTADEFYQYSAANILKGDNIRLQDITVSYTFPKIKGVRNLKIYGNIQNLGIIWRSNHYGLDPDLGTYGTIPAQRIYAIGLSGNF